MYDHIRDGVAGPVDERAWSQVVDILLTHDHQRLQAVFPDRFRIALANRGFGDRLFRSDAWKLRKDLLARIPTEAFDERYGTFKVDGLLLDYVYAFVWVALWETRHRRRDGTIRPPFTRVTRTRWATGRVDQATAAVDLFVWQGRVLVSRLYCVVPND